MKVILQKNKSASYNQ